MKHLKLFEAFTSNPTLVEFPIIINGNEVGYVSGIIHYRRDYLNNWLENEGVDEVVFDYFNSYSDSELFPIGILKNINIEEEYKHKGYGNIGMDMLLEKMDDTKMIILISDLNESNNFDLTKWYEKFGFKIIGYSSGLPFMVKSYDPDDISFF